jgi:hypothetical protein
MTTIYSELLAAAGAEFLPQAEGEPDGHYLRRLVLAVSKASDNDWERLSKEAQDWYNAQAKRVKAHQDPEHCPGFNPQMIVVDEASSIPKIVDAVVDAGWPEKPTPQQIMDSVTTALDEDLKTPMFHEGPIVDVPPQYVKMVDEMVNSKHTATDAVRALVMLHTDWNQAQIMRELESQGRVVSIGTIATVRSMTLATIAVAKGLGKWVEG